MTGETAAVTSRRQQDEAIGRLSRDFSDQVSDALKSAREARAAVAELVSPRVYDVELAAGAGGDDALAELDGALRHLRNAARIAKWRRSLMPEDPARPGCA